MTKVFKNYILNIFIVTVFFLSQIINVNANDLKIISQKEEIVDYVMEKNKATHVVAFDFLDSNHRTNNNALSQGKIEKIAVLVKLGTFEIAVALGYAAATVGFLIGLVIKKIVTLYK
ncbi:hypothetical protein [Bartonella raoultii]|uniref:hypothetical protein n=1 Tax=Bartonella raoultii TaxID=1457020 RepID=UPI001ABA4CAA|nr:hypothetical protein [Bartonella raoultii]